MLSDFQQAFDRPIWGSVTTRSPINDNCHGVKAGGIAKRFAVGLEYESKLPDEVQFIINCEQSTGNMDSVQRLKVLAQQSGTIKVDKDTQNELKEMANALKDEYIKMFTGFKLEIVRIDSGQNGLLNASIILCRRIYLAIKMTIRPSQEFIDKYTPKYRKLEKTSANLKEIEQLKRDMKKSKNEFAQERDQLEDIFSNLK